MFIKQLIIKETYPTTKNIRDIIFHKGMNFIVDAGKDQQKGNAVGKTTILRLIDICLGARDRKYIYNDFETNQTNKVLRDYIFKSKIFVDLIVGKDMVSTENDIVLSVGLFERAKRYINGEEQPYSRYVEELNKIFFDNNTNVPTFRQLIHMFVRINQKNDNNKFLEFLERASNDTYENIYSYLFELQEQSVGNEILSLKKELSAKEKELSNFSNLNNIKSVDVINQKILLLETQIEDLNKQMDVLINSKKFKENEEKISEIKIEYADFNDKLDLLLFKRQRVVSILEEAQEEVNQSIDINNDILLDFYKETLNLIGDLHKEFGELVTFNEQLAQNKVNYFRVRLLKLDDNIAELKKSKEKLLKEHSNIIMLIEDNKIDEYTNLQKDLAEYNKELGKSKSIQEIYRYLEEEVEEYKESLNKAEESSSIVDANIGIFNTEFTKYSSQTNGEPFMLYKKDKGFPLGIDYVKSSLSTGTRKSLIIAFDLAYQKLAEILGKSVPNFIIHDIIEIVDKVALNSIIDIVNSLDTQYIVAVLKEKIEGNEKIVDEDIVEVLSESNKPFGI